MAQFIQVCEDYNEMDSIEIPSEDDGSLLLTTLAAQFPGACGLKYKSESGTYRGIRFADGVMYPPDDQWGNYHYVVVFPKTEKRKGDDGFGGNPVTKLKRTTVDKTKCSDLIVLGLPWKSTEDDLKNYFCQFGELVLTQVKRDARTGQSKGFGFIRFANVESQVKCMSQRHKIDDRWCGVTIPNSKQGGLDSSTARKIFVGRCSEEISTEDLRCYFCKFGEVVDVFIPKPFRAFAFVTFADADVVQPLCGDDHIIKGTSVHISNASPKSSERAGPQKSGFGGYGQPGAYDGPANFGGMPKGNGDIPTPNTLGMNLLNSAMLAAAQAMLSGHSGWGGPAPMGQQGSAPDPPSQNSNSAYNQSQSPNTGPSWWGSESAPPSGSYPNWGSHGQRGTWN